jgi:inner membrane protein
MEQLLPFAGSYFWWIAAGLLLIAEMNMPGFFMLWLAFAAALTGLIDVLFHLGWVAEVFTFAGLSFISVLASWRFVMGSRNMKSDSPHLNQKHTGFVGRSFILDKAIIHGSGKIKVEDVLWDVDGPDLAAGTWVKVTAVNGLRLMVEKAA